jgi:membrane protein implicated in regulation of membrane protease activity
MNTLVHADIFFFVTTIAVVVVAIALTVALVYLAKVLSDVKEITRQVKEETALFRGDIADLRTDIKREGFRLERLAMFARNLFKKAGAARKPSRSKKQ